MASQTLPVPMRQARKRVQVATNVRAPSLRTALVVFVTLLILFRWLHLILALQIASAGRQIQIKTEELNRIERQNASLREKIAEASLPSRLSSKAALRGYGPRDRVYLPVESPTATAPAAQGRGGSGPDEHPGVVDASIVVDALSEVFGTSTAARVEP